MLRLTKRNEPVKEVGEDLDSQPQSKWINLMNKEKAERVE